MSSRDADVAIVGGGIVGAAVGFWAAKAGLSVIGVERDDVGAGSTGAGTGHVVVLDSQPELLALTSYSRNLWHDVAPSLATSVAWRVPGTVWLAPDSAALRELAARRSRLAGAGVDAKLLDAAELRHLEPIVAPGIAGGLLVPDDALLDPAAAARALWQASGARLELGVAVRRWTDAGLKLADGRSLSARHLVNAAGCGAPALDPAIDVRPRKGHVLRLAPGAASIRHVLVAAGYPAAGGSGKSLTVAFNAQPQPDGGIRLGSSRESAAEGSGVDPAVVARLRGEARTYAPELLDRPVENVSVGFRPAAPDDLPWIGAVPGAPGRWVAAGHEGFGVTTALATGRLLVDLITGERPALPMTPFRPGRPPSPA